MVDLADLVGLYIVMNGVSGKGELKVLVAGVGKLSDFAHSDCEHFSCFGVTFGMLSV